MSLLNYPPDVSAEERAEFDEWFAGRPKEIQVMIVSHPPWQRYRVKAGAPYAITGPGSIGQIISYFEDGTVRFETEAPQPQVMAGDHVLTARGEWHPLPPEGIHAALDPKWLEVVAEVSHG